MTNSKLQPKAIQLQPANTRRLCNVVWTQLPLQSGILLGGDEAPYRSRLNFVYYWRQIVQCSAAVLFNEIPFSIRIIIPALVYFHCKYKLFFNLCNVHFSISPASSEAYLLIHIFFNACVFNFKMEPKHSFLCYLLETPFSIWKEVDKKDLLLHQQPQPSLFSITHVSSTSKPQHTANFYNSWYINYPQLWTSYFSKTFLLTMPFSVNKWK